MGSVRRGAQSNVTVTAEAPALDDALDRLLDPLDLLGSFGAAGPRTANKERLPVLAGARASRGADVFVSVTLRAADLRAGARPVVRFTLREPCAECGPPGSAQPPRKECEHCGGTGVMEVEHLLGVRIPPGVCDGAELRARGEGNVSSDGGASGDLFVRVHVGLRANRLKRALYAICTVALAVLAVLAYLRFF